MKLIKISTDMELTVHDFPEGDCVQQNEVLRGLIGNHCNNYEHVMPRRLYKDLGMKDHPTKIQGQCVSMLVDEEGLPKENEPNLIGSYLYESEKHGNPIMGNVLFVGEQWGKDGIDFCGIEESVFRKLELQLNNMIYTMKATKEAIGK
ncbi:MAG: hypothetical protein NC347_06835 [Clostridium sp.]|nr:hypothetical protein [Clostridium sp.]